MPLQQQHWLAKRQKSEEYTHSLQGQSSYAGHRSSCSVLACPLEGYSHTQSTCQSGCTPVPSDGKLEEEILATCRPGIPCSLCQGDRLLVSYIQFTETEQTVYSVYIFFQCLSFLYLSLSICCMFALCSLCLSFCCFPLPLPLSRAELILFIEHCATNQIVCHFSAQADSGMQERVLKETVIEFAA